MNSTYNCLKLQFPKFTSNDRTGWIYEAELYFDFQEVNLNQRVQLGSFHLEGFALQWHHWVTKTRRPIPWVDFTTTLRRHFDRTDFDDPFEALTRVRQTTTLDAYQQDFERLS